MSESELQPGEIVAEKYSIVEPIGVGGSATVYRARQIGMTREVALKVMHAEHPDSDNEKIRFAREAEFVMKLQHPHVVPLLDYGHTVDDVPFLVFALLHGRSLEQKVRADGSMPWAQTGRVAAQVLKALSKAHSLGVVHRDIKPANIFLCDGVLGEVAQVLDFGLAKMVKEQDTDLTQAGALLGTPRYMAPEQVRGEKITHAADLYSFGLVMAEMLLGRPLVTGTKELDIYVAQGSDKPIFVPDEVLSTPYGNIIQRAVTKRVEVRYHMASQMLADVQAVLDNLEMPHDDVEADLDATCMIDPSMAAVASNPHAEKMRRVLNAAANKKAAENERKANRASKGANAATNVTERPTFVPPRPHQLAPLPIAPPEDPGPPPPIPAAAYDNDPPMVSATAELLATMPLPQNLVSSIPPVIHAPLNHVSMSDSPRREPSLGTAPTDEQLSDAATDGSCPVTPGNGANLRVGHSGPISGPSLSVPSSKSPAAAGRLSMPSSAEVPRPRPRQTGLAVALILVVILILAGMGAIVWMLGILPV